MVALNKYLVLVVFIAGFIGTFATKNKATRKVSVKAKYVPGNTLRGTPAGESWFNEILKFFNWLFFGGSIGDPSPFPGTLIKPEMMATFMGVPPYFKIDSNYTSRYNDLSQMVFFNLYTRNNMDNPQKIKLGDTKSLNDSNYDANNPTVFVTHGYLNNLNSSAVQTPKNALLKASNYNVIVVDWGKIAFTLYPEAVQEVQRVGAYVAEFIKFLKSCGKLDLTTTHLIGHSLGAHAMGVAGKKLAGFELGRITGLDPAGLGFNNTSPDKRIDASDANYVDCIHTDIHGLGIMKATCQSDFYVNGGKTQPGCLVLDFCLFGLCSHMRVIEYFSESVNGQFKAYKCNKIPDATGKGCKVSNALMGYPANISMKGQFYVKTNSQSPYAIN